MTALSGPAVAILDVGHGNSALLMEDGWAALVDARQGGVVDDALMHFGVTVLDEVVISHADADHCDGASTLVLGDPCGVRRLHIRADPYKDTQTWRDLVVALGEADDAGRVDLQIGPTRGASLGRPGGRMEVVVLAPTAGEILRAPHPKIAGGLSTNGMSTVMRVMVDGASELLLPGDLDGPGLTRLVTAGADLSAHTLVFPHHGGTPGGEDPARFTSRLLDQVRPEHVVFSVHRNDGRFPRPEIVEQVRRSGSSPRVSCTQLSARCAASVPSTRPSHLAALPAAGLTRSCCAGSMLLTFGPDAVVPAHARHLAFIATNAPAAMCGQA